VNLGRAATILRALARLAKERQRAAGGDVRGRKTVVAEVPQAIANANGKACAAEKRLCQSWHNRSPAVKTNLTRG